MVKRQSEMNLGALNKAQAKLQEKETLVSLRESEVASVKGELQEMQVKIIGLQRAMVEKDRTIEMCRDKVASKQYELDEVVVKLDGLSKEKQGLEREVQELREEILVIKVRGDEGWAEQRDEVS
jgi:chromosome segregation ATPase